jgi:predicted nucleic acid-binding protein
MTKDRQHVVLDTSCIIPLVCGWHEHHSTTMQAVETCLAEGRTLALAAHSLVEAYSVLTRLPSPHRMAPEAAFGLLEQNFRQDTETAQLDALEVWTLLSDARSIGVAGGRTYDALIAASARKLASPLLLTWNLKHLAPFEDAGLSIASPETKVASGES